MKIDLINLLSDNKFSRKEKILLILFSTEDNIKVNKIAEIAKSNGFLEIQNWNVSNILSTLKGMAVKLPNGWAITNKGKQYISGLGVVGAGPIQNTKPVLRKNLSQISNKHVKQFVEETICALESGLLRSAVVLSWNGAVSILYDEVVNNHISLFNTEARSRFQNWKKASTADDLARMSEYNFLQILESLSIIGKNVKNELEECLKLRNSCSHPSSLRIGEYKVSAHIETLILNVYSKFNA